MFINQSIKITVGGSTAAGNIISGNHGSGMFISGHDPDSTNVQPGQRHDAATNLIPGNQIGVGQGGGASTPSPA